MAVGTLLVSLTPHQPHEAVLQAAVAITGRLGIHVDGLALSERAPRRAPQFCPGGTGDTACEAAFAALETAFRTAMRGHAPSLGWAAGMTDAPLSQAIAAEARGVDLVLIAGNHDTAQQEAAGPVDLGDLVLRAGRPVLVVPPAARKLTFDHAVIGWNDSAPARRALADSLPLLRKYRRVTLCEVAPHAEATATRARLASLAGRLARHAIQAEHRVIESPYAEADRLTDLAAEEQADLVISGGYAHHRLQESVFGGVTRQLLLQNAFCVLLSH